MGASPPIFTAGSVPDVRLYPSHIVQMADARPQMPLSAQAALLVDMDSGAVLLERAANTPLPPASTTKIMTAILVLEEGGNLEQAVTVPGDVQVAGSSANLQPGETRTLRELLYALLLPSGNDAAAVLARHIAGSEEAFVRRMNDKAAALGLANTHFDNPHGLDGATHYTSAVDLWKLTQYALQYPLFAEIVATPSITIADHTWENTNELLRTYPGADGVKTGTTDLAGQCLVATVRHNGRRALAVILGSADRYADARTLFDYYKHHFAWTTLALPANAFTRFRDGTGRLYMLRQTSTPSLFLPRWQQGMVRRALRVWIGADGRPTGSVTFYWGPQRLAEAPLEAVEP